MRQEHVGLDRAHTLQRNTLLGNIPLAQLCHVSTYFLHRFSCFNISTQRKHSMNAEPHPAAATGLWSVMSPGTAAAYSTVQNTAT